MISVDQYPECNASSEVDHNVSFYLTSGDVFPRCSSNNQKDIASNNLPSPFHPCHSHLFCEENRLNIGGRCQMWNRQPESKRGSSWWLTVPKNPLWNMDSLNVLAVCLLSLKVSVCDEQRCEKINWVLDAFCSARLPGATGPRGGLDGPK